MSTTDHRIGWAGQNELVYFPDDVTLQAALDLFGLQALLNTSRHVGARFPVVPHPHHGNSPQRIVA
tara:strand:+ start:183 stop:380 length:198 start_codon:yes stop_codon:yes gene_type:complete